MDINWWIETLYNKISFQASLDKDLQNVKGFEGCIKISFFWKVWKENNFKWKEQIVNISNCLKGLT